MKYIYVKNETKRKLRDTVLILMHAVLFMQQRFRTTTLKTLTAFNFRWPSILFSLVWPTFSRSTHPLRHASHASAKEITCPPPNPTFASHPLAKIFPSRPFVSESCISRVTISVYHQPIQKPFYFSQIQNQIQNLFLTK